MTDNFQSLYQRIIEFNQLRVKESRLSHIIENGLVVFLEMPDVQFASLYLMNDDSFEFYHSKTLPDEIQETSERIFPELVENGLVGKALSSIELSFDKLNGFQIENLYPIILPLISSKGIQGLVVFTTSVNPAECAFELCSLANTFSIVFSTALENVILNQKNKKNQELLDQQVAFRTMKLVESQKKLADKFEDLRSNLSMSIPHEVRTPINQILGFSDFLLKYYKTTEVEDAEEMLQDIHSSAKRLKELFENYLYYANLSILATNVYDIMNLQQMVTPSLESAVYDAVAYKSEAFNRIDDIVIEVEDTALAISEEYLKKTMYEILDNSFKYSNPGTPIEITCKKAVDDSISPLGICEITIKDYGSGMTEEQITNMDAYMQFDRKVQEQQGSGLGISICQRIIDLHNGIFKIDSVKEEYTKVTMKLPVSNKSFD